jgi:hypothetical protein
MEEVTRVCILSNITLLDYMLIGFPGTSSQIVNS